MSKSASCAAVAPQARPDLPVIKTFHSAVSNRLHSPGIPAEEQRLNHLFDQLVELPSAERTAFLNSHCAGNPQLKHKLSVLLQGADNPPPAEFMNPLTMVRTLFWVLRTENER